MDIVFETNRLGYIAWPIGLDGSFVRGSGIEQIRRKRSKELEEWAAWLQRPDISVPDWHEILEETSAQVQDGDTEILLSSDLDGYVDDAQLHQAFADAEVSSVQVDRIFSRCLAIKDRTDPLMQRTTFYGPTYATISDQYRHIIDTQHFYLQIIGTDATWAADSKLCDSRRIVIEALTELYSRIGNTVILDKDTGEEWTIRKVARRLIVHDRLHGRAMSRMRERLL